MRQSMEVYPPTTPMRQSLEVHPYYDTHEAVSGSTPPLRHHFGVFFTLLESIMMSYVETETKAQQI